MDKKARIAMITSLIIAISLIALIVYAAPKKCNNGIDDDNDGLVDYPSDPGCSATADNSETSTSLVCDDGIDQTNDRDTLADFRLSSGDPGCTSTSDTSELDGDCDDLDDESTDRDSLTDSTDPGCTSTSDTSELDGDCDDLDDESTDRDSLTDSTDPGCTSTSDTSELDGDCDDLDDESTDSDSLTDSTDPGCTSTSDTSELDGDCDDLSDNDSDTQTDYLIDFECGSYADVEYDCSDSDGGIVSTVRGTTLGSFGGTPFNSTDVCAGNLTVTEYYCNPYNIGNQSINCVGNATCVNGACG